MPSTSWRDDLPGFREAGRLGQVSEMVNAPMIELATSLAPRWLGRTHVTFGLVGAVGFVARIPVFDPPLMIHLVPGLLGLVLLVRARGRVGAT
jgi:hypothetical protein